MIKVVEQKARIVNHTPIAPIILGARTCYQSFDRSSPKANEKLLAHLIKSGHHSVLEHSSMTANIVTDRGVTHELVRHRIAAFSQESTRYCNYFQNDVEFILPVWASKKALVTISDKGSINGSLKDIPKAEQAWLDACFSSAETYKELLVDHAWTPQKARTVLNNSLKAQIIITANLREWRHIFSLRTSKKAHPQMRRLMVDLFIQAKIIYGDVLFSRDLLEL